MASVDLTKAKEVIVKTHAGDVTRFINAGWSLIDTASGKDESGYPLTLYSLAWLGEGEPAEPQR
ncbi:hypothetical protein [Trinickia diaoshuihuensis]|uniref:hypothetical protein n=1 Tax=Trinickia diaoshuihuensis TaxID=2292265 RepID=UPI0013C31E76|nr:hypothetical protein [Trinickia diaoshuihuensis]